MDAKPAKSNNENKLEYPDLTNGLTDAEVETALSGLSLDDLNALDKLLDDAIESDDFNSNKAGQRRTRQKFKKSSKLKYYKQQQANNNKDYDEEPETDSNSNAENFKFSQNSYKSILDGDDDDRCGGGGGGGGTSKDAYKSSKKKPKYDNNDDCGGGGGDVENRKSCDFGSEQTICTDRTRKKKPPTRPMSKQATNCYDNDKVGESKQSKQRPRPRPRPPKPTRPSTPSPPDDDSDDGCLEHLLPSAPKRMFKDYDDVRYNNKQNDYIMTDFQEKAKESPSNLYKGNLIKELSSQMFGVNGDGEASSQQSDESNENLRKSGTPTDDELLDARIYERHQLARIAHLQDREREAQNLDPETSVDQQLKELESKINVEQALNGGSFIATNDQNPARYLISTKDGDLIPSDNEMIDIRLQQDEANSAQLDFDNYPSVHPQIDSIRRNKREDKKTDDAPADSQESYVKKLLDSFPRDQSNQGSNLLNAVAFHEPHVRTKRS